MAGKKGAKWKSDTSRKRMSKIMIGNNHQEKIRSIETKRRISLALLNNQNTLGKVYGKQTRLRDSLGKIGNKNPAWKGGISFEPYPPEFNAIFRESILVRDNYTCQLCFAKPENKSKLHPHHMDYDKSNCHSENMVTLCNSCHSKTNHHRENWGIFNGQFQKISAYA